MEGDQDHAGEASITAREEWQELPVSCVPLMSWVGAMAASRPQEGLGDGGREAGEAMGRHLPASTRTSS